MTEATKRRADNGPCAVGSAEEVLQCVPLSKAGRAMVKADNHGSVLLSRLIESNREFDAVRLMPFLMPIRQAIWWGVLCAWRGNGGQPGLLEDEALNAAVAWVRNPGEIEWKAAETAGKADGGETAGGCCALAIGWTGFCSPLADWTHRDIRVASRLLAGGVLTAIGESKPAVHPRRFLSLGIEVARGIYPWEGDPPG